MQSALFDPQTAGGLLISIAADKAADLLNAIPSGEVIGRVEEFSGKLIEVE
jgi:selenophosphate synthase